MIVRQIAPRQRGGSRSEGRSRWSSPGGRTRVTLDASGFAVVNLGLVAVWIALAVALVRRNRRLTGEAEDPARAGTAA